MAIRYSIEFMPLEGEAPMCKPLYLLLFFTITTTLLYAQDTAEEDTVAEVSNPDTVVTNRYSYWKKGYYKDIPVARDWGTAPQSSFDTMVAHYKNKDFVYIQSISDKVNIFDTLVERFNRLLRHLFPEKKGNSKWLNDNLFTLLAIVGLAGVLLLGYKLLFNRKKIFLKLATEGQDEDEELAYVEKHLMDIDLTGFVAKAVDLQNYALAIRYLQLQNIQLLNRKEVFRWKPSKTNAELMDELEDPALKADFKSCTVLFDRVWFGGFPLNKMVFNGYASQFDAFQRRWS